MKQFPLCRTHEDSEIEFLQMNQDHFDLFCSQCLYSLQNEVNTIDLKQIIHLKTIKKDPEGFIYRIQPKFEKKKLESFIIVDQHIRFLEKSLQEIEQCKNSIDKLIDQTKLNISQAKGIQKEMRAKLFQIIQFDSQIMNPKAQETDETMSDDVKQKQQELFKKLEDLKKNLSEIYKQVQDTISPQLELQKGQQLFFVNQSYQIYSLFKSYIVNISSEICIQNCQQSLLDQIYFQELCKKIEYRLAFKISSIVKLFQGSKDGLDTIKMNAKISGKQKLLFIFQSKTTNIFGCFLAGQWKDYENISDSTLSSFIFSYTLQEIYPLKASSNACKTYYQDYIGFGGTDKNDFDIYITKDFQKGYSQLGVGYQAIGKDATQKSTYLFGGLEPNIIECEIYELK